MNEQPSSKKLVLEVVRREGIHEQPNALQVVADDGNRWPIAYLPDNFEIRNTLEPPEEPSVMGGMLSQPRPPVPSGVKLIEWCVQQIQITCDALNLDPVQWLNDSTAQDDSSQPPPDECPGHYKIAARNVCTMFPYCRCSPEARAADDFERKRAAESTTPPPKPAHAVLTLPECPYSTCDAPLICLKKGGCRQPALTKPAEQPAKLLAASCTDCRPLGHATLRPRCSDCPRMGEEAKS